jgi:protein-tyrosine phosphatase
VHTDSSGGGFPDRPDGADQRRIGLPGTMNLRDLGGYPAGDGGVVRWRTLLRSDALDRLDENGRTALAALGLRTVVDLRTDEEAQDAPSALEGTGARIFRVPLLRAEALGRLPPDLAAVYRYLIDDRGPAIATAVGHLCRAGALPGLVHCSAGKDRTGVVTALILGALGVPDDIIAADYALSASYLDPDAAAVISRIQAIGGAASRLSLSVLGSPPELILMALARARARAGSVCGYLVRHGLSEAELGELRTALVAYPAAGSSPAGPGEPPPAGASP